MCRRQRVVKPGCTDVENSNWVDSGKVPQRVRRRRRIYTEEKAKVVAAVWRTELIQFLHPLAVLHQDAMKKRMNCTMDDRKKSINCTRMTGRIG